MPWDVSMIGGLWFSDFGADELIVVGASFLLAIAV